MDLGLAGLRAVICGGSRGIGRAIAWRLAQEGATVSVAARTQADLDTLGTAFSEAGMTPPHLVAADVSTEAGAQAAVAQAAAAMGGLDIVVANVGKSFARHCDDMTAEDLEASLRMNLLAAAHCARAAMPWLKQSAQPSLLMVSSIFGREAGGAPGYNVAKAAVIALAKAFARDYAGLGIRCNSVAPGSIRFPGSGWDRRAIADPVGIAKFVEHEIPAGRFGTPEEVADVAAFLASPRARWVNGACIVVDGAQSRSF